MADYPPPQESNPIWNPANFLYGSSNLTIDTANSLYIKKTGADTAVGPLTIKNDLTIQGEMYASAGLVSAPSYSFTSETNSGLYRNAAGDLRISILGADSLGITAGIVNIYDYVRGGHGSQVAPIYSFRGNSDTGVYSLGAGSGGIGFSTGTDLCCYMQYKRSYFGDGTGAALPSISFINENNTGLYRAGVNDLRISVNGVDRIQQSTTATQINQPLLLSNGSVSNPAYSFASETSLGWYRAGVGDIRLAQLGSDALTYSGSQFLVNGRQRTTIAGTASNPAIKIGTDDTNMTGFYNNGIYALTVSVGQQAVADFRNSGGRGIRLYGDTSGNNALYSPSVLGYYEDRTESMQFSFSPGGQTTAVGNVRFIKIGNKVTMQIPQYASIQNNSGGSRAYASTTAIPLRFQPPYLVMSGLIGYVNGGNNNTLSCYINAGIIYIERLTAQFSNGDTFLPYAFTMTWII
jgi:hypothetical protein